MQQFLVYFEKKYRQIYEQDKDAHMKWAGAGARAGAAHTVVVCRILHALHGPRRRRPSPRAVLSIAARQASHVHTSSPLPFHSLARRRYERANKPAAVFEADVQRFRDLSEEVLSEESLSSMRFLRLDCGPLKQVQRAPVGAASRLACWACCLQPLAASLAQL